MILRILTAVMDLMLRRTRAMVPSTAKRLSHLSRARLPRKCEMIGVITFCLAFLLSIFGIHFVSSRHSHEGSFV